MFDEVLVIATVKTVTMRFLGGFKAESSLIIAGFTSVVYKGSKVTLYPLLSYIHSSNIEKLS